MQRGTTRRRASSDEGDNIDHPRQRQRNSTVLSTASSTSTETPDVTPSQTSVPSPDRDHQPSLLSSRVMTDMGPPLPTSSSNGKSLSTSPTNGHAAFSSNGSSSIRLVKPEGKLLYEDDQDWAEHEDEDAIMEDSPEKDGEVAESSRRKQGGFKRMPVDREEVVRLILQGLRDIGYE